MLSLRYTADIQSEISSRQLEYRDWAVDIDLEVIILEQTVETMCLNRSPRKSIEWEKGGPKDSPLGPNNL